MFCADNVADPSTLAATAPAGRQAGDVLFCVTFCRSITATVSTPSGWNLISSFPRRSATASGGSVYMFSRTADGTSADNCSPSWSGVTTGTSGDSSGAVILAYSGLSGATSNSSGNIDGASTNTSTIPATTTIHNNALVIGVALKILESAGQTSTVTTFTERYDGSTTSGTGHIEEISDIALTGQNSAGSSGTATVTWSATTSARSLRFSIGFQSIMPTGSAALALVSSFVAAGVRKALGAAARSETVTFVATGVRKTFGAAARSEVLSFVAAGVRKTFGAAARPQVLTLTAAGTRTTLGVATLSETITFHAAGTRTTLGAAARTETMAFTAAAVVTRHGAAALNLTADLDAAGTRTAVAAAALNLAIGLTATGTRATFGSASLPLVLTFTASADGPFPAGAAGTITQTATGDITVDLTGRISSAGIGRITKARDGELTRATP